MYMLILVPPNFLIILLEKLNEQIIFVAHISSNGTRSHKSVGIIQYYCAPPYEPYFALLVHREFCKLYGCILCLLTKIVKERKRLPRILYTFVFYR